jgi:general secretion pathway protein E
VPSTFHASGSAGVLDLLAEMGIERLLPRSGLLVVISQRLARRHRACAWAADDLAEWLGLPTQERVPSFLPPDVPE